MSLGELPVELMQSIAEHLDRVGDLNALSYANRRMHTIVDPYVWTLDARNRCDGLYYGIRSNEVQLVQKALDCGAPLQGRPPMNLFESPLHCAIYRGHLDVVKLLHWKGAKLIVTSSVARHSPLTLAASRGHTSLVKFFLDEGATIEWKCRPGHTALTQAVQFEHQETAILLLDRGADLEAGREIAQTSLYLAVKYAYKDLVHILLERGADETCGRVESGNLIHRFAEAEPSWKSSYQETLRYLMDRGEDINGKCLERGTPLMIAISTASIGMIKMLRENGASVVLPNDYRYPGEPYTVTPLQLAVIYQREQVVSALLEVGADIDGLSSPGETALSVAVRNKNKKIATLLLEKGADLERAASIEDNLLPKAIWNYYRFKRSDSKWGREE